MKAAVKRAQTLVACAPIFLDTETTETLACRKVYPLLGIC
jgi:hypothetical protein